MLVADLKSLKLQKEKFAGSVPKALISAAQKAASISVDPVSNKKYYLFGATPNDYVSLGTYWWENPETESGLPFIRRDGYINPLGHDLERYDRKRIDTMTQAVFVLSTAYFYTEDIRFKQAAQRHLDAWFVDKNTKMNPSLTYAQQIPGICSGRDIGIIDTHSLIDLIDSATLLGYEHIDVLRNWAAQYLDWLKTSENGRGEATQENNHGLWYDTQLIAFASFAGNVKTVRQTAQSIRSRLVLQVAPDGSFPKELSRTRSFMYSIFALRAAYYAHRIAEQNGCEVLDEKWKKCFDFLLPFASGERKWEHQQIDDVPPQNAAVCMRFGGMIYGDDAYTRTAKKLYESFEDESAYTFRFPIV